MVRCILSFIMILIASAAVAGNYLNGELVDRDGKGVKGAKIWVTDEDAYSKSDKKGRFGLTDVEDNDTIYIKYKKKFYSVPVEGRHGLRVVILDEGRFSSEEDRILYDKGMEYVSRREYVSYTDGIPGERLVRTGCNNILDAISGLVPGVDVRPNGQVIIRGASTFQSSFQQPLFLVNTSQVPDFNGINIHDVEYVEVLKDASFYGTKGMFGAIIVHTKRQ